VSRSIVLLLRMLLLYAYLMPAFFLATAATESISTYLFDLLVRSIDVLLSRDQVRCSHIRGMKEED